MFGYGESLSSRFITDFTLTFDQGVGHHEQLQQLSVSKGCNQSLHSNDWFKPWLANAKQENLDYLTQTVYPRLITYQW